MLIIIKEDTLFFVHQPLPLVLGFLSSFLAPPLNVNYGSSLF